jgi:hypothetical protein
MSLAGDAAVPGMLWLSWAHPAAALVVLGVAVLAMWVVTVMLIRFLRMLFARLRGVGGKLGSPA